LGRKIAAFLVVVTPLQMWLFSHYNGILKEPSAPSVQTEPRTNTSASSISAKDSLQKLATLSQKYPVAALSDDMTTIAYVDAGQDIHVKNLTSGQDTILVQMKAPVVYLSWIGSGLLFVGEKFSVNGSNHLTLATVDLQTKEPRIIQPWSGLSSSTTFKKIAFSSATNDVYVLLGNTYNSALYHYDANGGTPTLVSLDGRFVQNVTVGQNNGILFFQDFAEGTKNVLYEQNHVAHLIQRNSVILGVVNDDLYYGTLDSNGLVNAVYDFSTAMPASDSAGTANTSGNTGTLDLSNSSPQLVKTLSTPTDASHVNITSDKQIVITTP
jgi:hypothetical protein